jgi:GntR family transcriptional regulator
MGNSKAPLYQWVEDSLRNDIISGVFEEGEMIPTENELATKYGVSPGTVRRAALSLKDKGLLYRVQGRGTSVVFQEANRRRYRNYRFVEGVQTRPDVVGVTVAFLGLMVLPADDLIAGYLQMRRGSKVIHLERMGKITDRYFLRTTSILPKRLYKGLELFTAEQFVRNTLWKLQESYFGLRIGKREEFISVSRADQKTAETLGVELGTPTLCIEALLTSVDGDVIEYRLSHCDPGHLKFYVSQDAF